MGEARADRLSSRATQTNRRISGQFVNFAQFRAWDVARLIFRIAQGTGFKDRARRRPAWTQPVVVVLE